MMKVFEAVSELYANASHGFLTFFGDFMRIMQRSFFCISFAINPALIWIHTMGIIEKGVSGNARRPTHRACTLFLNTFSYTCTCLIMHKCILTQVYKCVQMDTYVICLHTHFHTYQHEHPRTHMSKRAHTRTTAGKHTGRAHTHTHTHTRARARARAKSFTSSSIVFCTSFAFEFVPFLHASNYPGQKIGHFGLCIIKTMFLSGSITRLARWRGWPRLRVSLHRNANKLDFSISHDWNSLLILRIIQVAVFFFFFFSFGQGSTVDFIFFTQNFEQLPMKNPW